MKLTLDEHNQIMRTKWRACEEFATFSFAHCDPAKAVLENEITLRVIYPLEPFERAPAHIREKMK